MDRSETSPTSNGLAFQKALKDLVIFHWGTPRKLIVDNGSEYDNNRIAQLVKNYSIDLAATPPYHQWANPTERCNRTLKPIIAMFVGYDQREWDFHIHEFRNAINTARHASTKVSPAFINFRRHALPVEDLRREVAKSQVVEPTTVEEWVEKLKRLENLRDKVRKHNDETQERQAKAFDQGKKKSSLLSGKKCGTSHTIS